MRGARAGLVAAAVLTAACADPAGLRPLPPERAALLQSLSPLGPLPPSPGNAVADDPRAAALGKRLFFDAGLSGNDRVSCATCHDPARYFTDGRARSFGLVEGTRNAPSLLVAPYYPFLSWDGRKDSLWSQALGALEDEREHGISRARVAHRISRAHRSAYEAAFGPLPDLSDPRRFPRDARPVPRDAGHPHHRAWSAMTPADRASVDRVFANAGKSIEAYLRLLVQREPSPFDRYVAAVAAGDPSGGGHLSAAALRGLEAFVGDAGCVLCHHGPLLSDREFHVVGPPPSFGAPTADAGRARGLAALDGDPFRCGGAESDARDCPTLRFLDRGAERYVGAFRTPSLRDVGETGPYMHGGELATLEDVIDFYRMLPEGPTAGERDPMLRHLPRELSTGDLVAFLRSLTAPPPSEPVLE